MKKIILFSSMAMFVIGCEKSDTSPVLFKADVSTPAPDTKPVDTQLPPENLKQEAVDPIPGTTFTGPRLGDISIGKTVWIHPYTVWVASPGNGLPNKTFINGYHNYYETRMPDTIQITRDDNGWVVDLRGSTQEWTAMKFPGIEGGSFDSQPVRFRR